MGEVLGTVRIPDNIVGALSSRFRITRADVGLLSTENRSSCGINSFLRHLASGVDLFPVFERVELMQVEQDGMVHLLHSLFSVPVGL